MAEADKTLELLIKTKADLAAAVEVQHSLEKTIFNSKLLGKEYTTQEAQLARVKKEIDNYSAAHHEAGHEVELFSEHGREMHRVIEQVTEAAPGLGLALRAAVHPENLGLAAVLVAFTLIKEKFEEMKRVAAETLARQAEMITALFAAQEDGYNKAIDTEQKFQAALEKRKSVIADIIDADNQSLAVLKAQQQAADDILAAQEKLALAQANGDKLKEDEIKRRFGDSKTNKSLTDEQAEISEKNDELRNLTTSTVPLLALKQSAAKTTKEGLENGKQNDTAAQAATKQNQLKEEQKKLDAAVAKEGDPQKLRDQLKTADTERNRYGMTGESEADDIKSKILAAEASRKAAEENRRQIRELDAPINAYKTALEKATQELTDSQAEYQKSVEEQKRLTDEIKTASAVLKVRRQGADAVKKIDDQTAFTEFANKNGATPIGGGFTLGDETKFAQLRQLQEHGAKLSEEQTKFLADFAAFVQSLIASHNRLGPLVVSMASSLVALDKRLSAGEDQMKLLSSKHTDGFNN